MSNIKCPKGHEDICYLQVVVESWEAIFDDHGGVELRDMIDATVDPNYGKFYCDGEGCDREYSIREIRDINKTGK